MPALPSERAADRELTRPDVAGIGLDRWRCPRCGRPFFYRYGWRDPLARRCLHCGLRKWSVTPEPDEPERDPRVPARPADLEAEIRFLATEQGGRKRYVATGYRGQLHYDDHDWDAIYGFLNREKVEPGDTVVAAVWLLSPEHHVGKLHAGKSFEVREGRKVVALGVVTRLAALGREERPPDAGHGSGVPQPRGDAGH